jgi:hypothetical protein
MRGLELLSPSQPPEGLGPPGLTELSIQIKQRWPSVPPPVLEWTETPLVPTDSSGIRWLIGPRFKAPRVRRRRVGKRRGADQK